ncbi:MAG: diguanylate cyclase [Desulfuromonas sp.]|nr:diguanylate cyclase [Desulfuromonas sp.]
MNDTDKVLIEQLQAENSRLRTENDQFRLFEKISSEPIAVFDDQSSILWVNSAFLRIFRYQEAEIIGKSVSILMTAESRETAKTHIKNQSNKPYEAIMARSDGSMFPALVQGTNLTHQGKSIRVATCTDITVTKANQRELEQVLAELEIFFDNSMIAVLVLRGGRIIYRVNQRFADMLGYDSPNELQGKSIRVIHLSEKNFVEFGQRFYDSLTEKAAHNIEHQLKHKDGSAIWALSAGKAVDINYPPDLNKGVVWIIYDLTQRKETEQQLIELATIDSLTGANTRRQFMELGEREFTINQRHGRSLSLLMLDIDHFKAINDRYGHDVGDKSLCRFTSFCQESLRTEDILGRLGGEEFAIILQDTEIEQALHVAERIRNTVESSTRSASSDTPAITVSIGIATTKGENDLAATLKQADIYLYQAKEKGRNCIVFAPDKAL